jgi:hypothetical protein
VTSLPCPAEATFLHSDRKLARAAQPIVGSLTSRRPAGYCLSLRLSQLIVVIAVFYSDELRPGFLLAALAVAGLVAASTGLV